MLPLDESTSRARRRVGADVFAALLQCCRWSDPVPRISPGLKLRIAGLFFLELLLDYAVLARCSRCFYSGGTTGSLNASASRYPLRLASPPALTRTAQYLNS